MKITLDQLTESLARTWLMNNDREARDYWSTCSGDLVNAVKDNLSDFGYDNQLGDVVIVRK